MTTPCIICVAITGSLAHQGQQPGVAYYYFLTDRKQHQAIEAGARTAHCQVYDDEGKAFSDELLSV